MSQESKVILHHLNNSRSQRILWLLEELDVPYEIKRYDRTPDRRAPKELYDVTPLGKSPVITDGDVTLGESGAIVEYIIQKYGKDKAQVPDAGFVDNLYYSHYAEGSLQPILVSSLYFSIIPTRTPFFIRPIINAVLTQAAKILVEEPLKIHAKMLEDHFSKGKDWIAGGPNPTSADFLMSFALETFVYRFPAFLGPKTKEYIARFSARPSYKIALEKGGDYDYAYKA